MTLIMDVSYPVWRLAKLSYILPSPVATSRIPYGNSTDLVFCQLDEDGLHNYEEPKTMADYVRPEYWWK